MRQYAKGESVHTPRPTNLPTPVALPAKAPLPVPIPATRGCRRCGEPLPPRTGKAGRPAVYCPACKAPRPKVVLAPVACELALQGCPGRFVPRPSTVGGPPRKYCSTRCRAIASRGETWAPVVRAREEGAPRPPAPVCACGASIVDRGRGPTPTACPACRRKERTAAELDRRRRAAEAPEPIAWTPVVYRVETPPLPSRESLLTRFAVALARATEVEACMELVRLGAGLRAGVWGIRGPNPGSWIKLETRDPLEALERARKEREAIARETVTLAAGRAPWYSLVRWKIHRHGGRESPCWYAKLCAAGRSKTVTTKREDEGEAHEVARELLARFVRGEPVALGRAPNGAGVKQGDTRTHLRTWIGEEMAADIRAALPGLEFGRAVRRLVIEALAFREVYGTPLAESVSSAGGEA